MFCLTGLFRLFVFFAFAGIVYGGPAHAQSAFDDPQDRQIQASGGGDGFVAVNAAVDGGSVPVGSTAQVVVRFKNDGGQPVQTGLIRLYPSSTISANVSLNQCEEEPLSPGAECAIALSVKGLQAGSWRVEMLMSHSGRSRLVTATLSGDVEASAEGAERLSSDLEAIPDSLDFGDLENSQTLVEPVILRNITSQPIQIDRIYIDSSAAAGFVLRTECDTLNPGQACIITVAWAPKLKGPVSGVLVVEHDGPTALASIPMSGEYEPESIGEAETFPEAIPGKGLLVASQSEVAFGSGIDASSTITVSLVNAGDSNMTINDIVIAGKESGLSLKEGGCSPGDVLEPIEACPLTVSWSPNRIGSLLDDIHILHDGARGILVLPVRGEADATVSKDQGTVILSQTGNTITQTRTAPSASRSQAGTSDAGSSGFESDVGGISEQQVAAAQENRQRLAQKAVFASGITNPASVLDGLRITSFSPRRAIVAGPGGSRLVFHREQVVLGGIPWDVFIQRNGIEFTFQNQTVLLLFDRSLSSSAVGDITQ